MSDYFTGLLDRHLGKGEMVVPRTPARFETGIAAAYLPQNAEEDTTSVDSPAPETLSVESTCVNSTGSDIPIDQPVPDQHQPGTPIKPESGPIELDIDNNTDNNKVSPHEPPILANPPQESVKPTIMKKNRMELNLENRPDNIVQTDTRGLLQPLQQNPSAGFEKPGNREHTVTVNTKIQEEGPINQQSHRQPFTPIFQDTGSDSQEFRAAASSLSGIYQPAPLEPVPLPELPVNGSGQSGQETVMVEPQPLPPAPQDNNTGSRGLLEAPAWLAGKQNPLQQELFYMDSKAEAEPVINVTIGRIEVRAVKQQEPPPPRRYVPPKPELSLDDYLEQRNRGEI